MFRCCRFDFSAATCCRRHADITLLDTLTPLFLPLRYAFVRFRHAVRALLPYMFYDSLIRAMLPLAIDTFAISLLRCRCFCHCR